MLLQLSQFLFLCPLCLVSTFPQAISHLSSCPWVVHISSLASPFPILFLYPPIFYIPIVILSPRILPLFFPFLLPADNLQMISVFMILFLFWLFALFVLDSVVDSCEFVVILMFIVLIFFFLDKSL